MVAGIVVIAAGVFGWMEYQSQSSPQSQFGPQPQIVGPKPLAISPAEAKTMLPGTWIWVQGYAESAGDPDGTTTLTYKTNGTWSLVHVFADGSPTDTQTGTWSIVDDPAHTQVIESSLTNAVPLSSYGNTLYIKETSNSGDSIDYDTLQFWSQDDMSISSIWGEGIDNVYHRLTQGVSAK